MDSYICIENFKLNLYDENDCPTEDYGMVEKNSIWEVSWTGRESEVRLNLVDGNSDSRYIDITKERLKKCLQRLKIKF